MSDPRRREIPINVRRAMLDHDHEALSALGQKGAKARARKRVVRKEPEKYVPGRPDGKMRAAHDE